MKYTTLPYDDSLTHGPVRVIVDKESDIKDLPKDFSAGSKAIVAESGRTYLLNNEQEWKKQPISTGGNNNAASEISIVQTIDSSSVQDEVPSAKAVYDFVSTNNLLIEARENNGQVILNKTWEEIATIFENGGSCRILSEMNGATVIFSVSDIMVMDDTYFVGCISAINNGPLMFGTGSFNGYPILNYDPTNPTNPNIQISLSNPQDYNEWTQDYNEWTWTANDANFSVTNYISTYSQNRNGPEFYVTVGSNGPVLATIKWEDENFDSNTLVLSVGTKTFLLQDTDHIATTVNGK